MLVGCWIGEHRDQGEALAKCLMPGLGKSRSLSAPAHRSSSGLVISPRIALASTV
jgi:hypothetical protein